MGDLVLDEVDEGIATVTLNRPDRMNTITLELALELLDVLARLADDDAVGVVVLTGAGRAFCAGADLSGGPPRAEGHGRTASQLTGDIRNLVRISQLLREMPKVTIAAINGACAGGGLSWAAACDLRLAASTAKFSTAFLGVGLPGDYGVTWTLTHLVGASRARELFLLAEKFDAAEAQRWGVVNRVFAPEELMGEVHLLARQLADRSPRAVRAMKQNLNDAQQTGFLQALEMETQRMVDCLLTADGGR